VNGWLAKCALLEKVNDKIHSNAVAELGFSIRQCRCSKIPQHLFYNPYIFPYASEYTTEILDGESFLYNHLYFGST
jgi:hypothetical protein